MYIVHIVFTIIQRRPILGLLFVESSSYSTFTVQKTLC